MWPVLLLVVAWGWWCWLSEPFLAPVDLQYSTTDDNGGVFLIQTFETIFEIELLGTIRKFCFLSYFVLDPLCLSYIIWHIWTSGWGILTM